MTRRLAVLCIFIVASLAGPSLFAAFCQDCPDSLNCITVESGAHFCEFFPDGGCTGLGTCRQASASLQAEYRVAAVHVISPDGKALPSQTQPKLPAVLSAAK